MVKAPCPWPSPSSQEWTPGMVAWPVIGWFENESRLTVPEHEPPLSVPLSTAGCGTRVIAGLHDAAICTFVQLTVNVFVPAAYDGAASTPAMTIEAPSSASRAPMRIPCSFREVPRRRL